MKKGPTHNSDNGTEAFKKGGGGGSYHDTGEKKVVKRGLVQKFTSCCNPDVFRRNTHVESLSIIHMKQQGHQ